MREVGWGLRNRACLEGIGPGGIMLVHVEKTTCILDVCVTWDPILSICI